ncbi:hypothetical protein RBB78_15660 [Tunturiibacter empetritectus]|uniref:lipopolysaccharide biosynthesis protein n=1 Tax=Tunturiibacter empetritectus TaxID=3069691 RepID=UPI003D9B6CAB
MSTEQLALKQTFFARILARIGGGRTPAALFDQGLVSGANFITNVVLARGFGIRDYGVFALAWVAVLFANSLQYALIITPMVSVGPKQEPEERPGYYGAVLLQEFIFAFSAALIMFVCVKLSVRFFPQWGVGNLALPISGATLAYLLQEFVRRYFFCTRQSKLALITDVVSYLTQLPIIYWIVHSHYASLSNVLWIIAATSFMGFITCLRWFEPVTFDQARFQKSISPALAHVSLACTHRLHAVGSRESLPHGRPGLLRSRRLRNHQGCKQHRRSGPRLVLRSGQRCAGRGIATDAPWRCRCNAPLHQTSSHPLGGVTLTFVTIVACFPTLWLKLAYGQKYSSDGSVLRLYALLYIFIFIAGPLRAALQALEYTAPIFWAYPALIAFSVALAGPFGSQPRTQRRHAGHVCHPVCLSDLHRRCALVPSS